MRATAEQADAVLAPPRGNRAIPPGSAPWSEVDGTAAGRNQPRTLGAASVTGDEVTDETRATSGGSSDGRVDLGHGASPAARRYRPAQAVSGLIALGTIVLLGRAWARRRAGPLTRQPDELDQET